MALSLTDLVMIERDGVLYQGTLAQIVALSGGGGGIVWNSVDLPVSTPVLYETEVVHVDALVTNTSTILVTVIPNDHNDISDISDDQIQVFAKAETGQIRFTITGNSYLCGPYTIKYGVS